MPEPAAASRSYGESREFPDASRGYGVLFSPSPGLGRGGRGVRAFPLSQPWERGPGVRAFPQLLGIEQIGGDDGRCGP
jgi:hypothetical protein